VPHLFRDLRCGEAFEEEFQVGLGLDLVGLRGFRRGTASHFRLYRECDGNLGRQKRMRRWLTALAVKKSLFWKDAQERKGVKAIHR
jgi:hypothetical protein